MRREYVKFSFRANRRGKFQKRDDAFETDLLTSGIAIRVRDGLGFYENNDIKAVPIRKNKRHPSILFGI